MKNALLLAALLLQAAPSAAQEPPPSSAAAVSPASLPGMSEAAKEAETPAATAYSGPWEVAEIAVKGNRNLKPKVISKTGKARKGKLYTQASIGEDIEAIMGLGSLDKVSVEIEPVPGRAVSAKLADAAGSTTAARVTYIVSEKPAVKQIVVEGAKGMSKGSVKEEMSVKEKDFLEEFRLREDMDKVEEKYREKGFIDAKADYEVSYDTAASTCKITVRVVEGNKAKLAAVELAGASGFKVKKLLGKLKNRPKKIYQPKELENDFKELETFYRNNGYADFKVAGSSVVFSEDRSSVRLRIDLEEGRRQRFGLTFFSGNTVYLPSDFTPDVAYRRGKLYNQELFDTTLRGLQDRYADKGYLRAAISADKAVNPRTGETDITFSVEENTQIFVGHIDIEGNKATKTHVLRREVTQKENEVFSSSKIRRSQEKIFNLGFIDDVSPVINPSPDPDKVDLVFDVTEGKPGMLTAGAGISSREGLVGTLSLSHMNLFGRAHKTSLSWNFGKRVQDYYLSWSTPWVGDSPTTLGVDLFNTRRYRPYRNTLAAYTERRTGGKITVAPRFQEDKYHLTTAYTYERVQIDDINDIYLNELSPGTSVTSSVFLEFARDTRDNVWDPTRGCRTSLSLEYAGGPLQGQVNYYKPTLSHSYNLKLFSIDDYPFVLAVANRFGFVDRFGSTKSVPIYERYFLGGADSIRGYANNGQIGPLNGGQVYNVLNVEFKFPLARERRRTIVQWAFFFDAGNSWEGFDSISTRFGTGRNDLKAGAGFGIRFTTPAFPIRLDWGYGFNHKTGEQRSDIYFTLGNMF